VNFLASGDQTTRAENTGTQYHELKIHKEATNTSVTVAAITFSEDKPL
jgi:hypothetical protein